MVGFIFGGDTNETAESIKRKRAVLNAMAAKTYAPKSIGEGIAAIGDALAYRMQDSALRKQEGEGVASTMGPMAAIGAALQGPSAFPPAPGSNEGASVPTGANASAIREGLIQRGLPEHVADGFLMNFKDESGLDPGINEKNPTVPGSRGGFGLYQLTGPRRTSFEQFAGQRGVDPSNVDAQLDFLMTELQGPEARAAQSIMASKDAGSAAAAIARDFLRPAKEHLDSRVSRYLSGAAPTQVASLYPAIGMASDLVQRGPMPPAEAAYQPIPNTPAAASSISPADALTQMAGRGLQESGAMQPANIRPQSVQVAQALQRGPNGKTAEEEIMGRAVDPNAGPSMQQLIDAASNPWMNENQSGVINALMGQKLKEMDPATALARRKSELEIRALENPPVKYDFLTGKDGSIFRTDNKGGMNQVYGGKPDKTNDVQNYEYYSSQEQAAGRQPVPFGDWKAAQSRAGASQVNIDQKAEGAFDKKAAEKQAEAFDTMASDGLNARADLGIINELDGLLQGQGGTFSGISGALAKYGIGGEGIDDLQAAQALINKLVPTQRQPGSGSMSDRDVELFTRSLPSLWNTLGGNQKILGVMRGLAQYKQQQGEIADQVLIGGMSRQEGRRALRELPNPLADFGKPEKAPPKKPTVIDGYSIEEAD